MAFPCNQFGKQEPDSPQQIQKFAQQQGVEFTMMEKIDVNGPNTHVVYQYLKYHTNLDLIHWNFDTYFVLDGQGNLSQFTGIESPMQLLEELEKLQQRSEDIVISLLYIHLYISQKNKRGLRHTHVVQSRGKTKKKKHQNHAVSCHYIYALLVLSFFFWIWRNKEVVLRISNALYL